MGAEKLLSQLGGVKRTGPNRWTARCPAHDDRRPSLAVRELDDGRVLVHDFAGCSIEEVLAAIDLTFDVLYPERAIGDHVKRERHPFNAGDILECVSTEALIVALVASDITKGKPISHADKSRVMLAASRLEAARGLANDN